MNTRAVNIVDIGRGPQIDGSRLTVMDIFYYLHRGHDFDFIRRAMPSLTREQFDAVAEYVNDHHEELIQEDRSVDEKVMREIAEQKSKGLYHEIDQSIPREQRVERLREKLRQNGHAEKNGGHSAG